MQNNSDNNNFANPLYENPFESVDNYSVPYVEPTQAQQYNGLLNINKNSSENSEISQENRNFVPDKGVIDKVGGYEPTRKEVGEEFHKLNNKNKCRLVRQVEILSQYIEDILDVIPYRRSLNQEIVVAVRNLIDTRKFIIRAFTIPKECTKKKVRKLCRVLDCLDDVESCISILYDKSQRDNYPLLIKSKQIKHILSEIGAIRNSVFNWKKRLEGKNIPKGSKTLRTAGELRSPQNE